MIGLRSLAPFASTPRPAGARCEVCASPLAERHRHVVEIGHRGVACACQACAILFERGDQAGRYRTVPDRVLRDPAFTLPAAELGVPVGLACFVRETERVATWYPGPAGITDGELDDVAWAALAAATPLAEQLVPHVEALLVYTPRSAPPRGCYLVPVTAAYELAGKLRTSWQGFTGGSETEAALAAFFAELDVRGGKR
jgi:hypothetical protein